MLLSRFKIYINTTIAILVITPAAQTKYVGTVVICVSFWWRVNATTADEDVLWKAQDGCEV